MRRYIKSIIAATLVALSMGGCAKFDEFSSVSQESVVEDLGGNAYYSTFHLPKLWTLADSIADGDIFDIKLELMPLSHRLTSYHYDATLTVGASYAIRFLIDSDVNEDLPMDKYLLRAYSADGKRYGPEFVLTVVDRCVLKSESVPDYSEIFDKGEGTEDSPYEISSNYAFEDLCDLLEEDSSRGRGKYFKQMQDLEIESNSGEFLVEEGWYNVDFAGSYDGNGFKTMGFGFNGARDGIAEDIGLFRTLLNGAVIKNMNLIASGISGVSKNAGVLAGSVAEGATVKISDCTLSGTISDSGNSIGGLIGYVYKADVTIENVGMGVNIHCATSDVSDTKTGYRVGGLIGFAVDSDVKINNASIYLNNLDIKGGWCVGGLIGETRDTVIDIWDTYLEIPASKILDTIVGKQYVGGAIGYLDTSYETARFNNVSIIYAVSGEKYVGGLIGRTSGGHGAPHIIFEDVYISSSLVGGSDVGGFVGHVANVNGGTTYFKFYGTCSFAPLSGNATSIQGRESVGGIFGALCSGAKSYFDYANKVIVASSVTATSENAGGLIGRGENIDLRVCNFYFDPASKIIAPKCVGGVIGYMNGGTLTGMASCWDFESLGCDRVPSFSEHGDAQIQVKIEETDSNSQYIGGVVGKVGPNSKVRCFTTQSEITGGKYVGGIVGGAIGDNIILEGLYPTGFVKGINIEIGGVVGRIEGNVSVKNSINYAELKSSDSGAEIGGVVGHAKYNGDHGGMPHVHYCVNVAPIAACSVAGGVVGILQINLEGYYDPIPVERCANFGMITGSGNSSYSGHTGFGGILGNSYNTHGARLAHCANFGDLVVNCSAHGVGGIAGAMGSDPKDPSYSEKDNFHLHSCANYGDISGSSGGFHCGGIIGYMEEGDDSKGNHACVEGCYNWGDIDVAVDSKHGLGGIAGYLDHYAELWRNINFKKPSGYTGDDNTGNIWGKNKGIHTVKYNYQAYDDATRADESKFGDLNINDDGSFWVMTTGDPHPQISDCPFQNATYSAK